MWPVSRPVLTHGLLGFACGIGILALPLGYPWHRWEVVTLLLVAGVLGGVVSETSIGGARTSLRRVVSGPVGWLLVMMVAGYFYGSWRIAGVTLHPTGERGI